MIYSDIYIYTCIRVHIHVIHVLYYFHIDQVLKIPKPSTIPWRASQAKDTEIPTASPTARPSVVRGKPSASARCLQLSS